MRWWMSVVVIVSIPMSHPDVAAYQNNKHITIVEATDIIIIYMSEVIIMSMYRVLV